METPNWIKNRLARQARQVQKDSETRRKQRFIDNKKFFEDNSPNTPLIFQNTELQNVKKGDDKKEIDFWDSLSTECYANFVVKALNIKSDVDPTCVVSVTVYGVVFRWFGSGGILTWSSCISTESYENKGVVLKSQDFSLAFLFYCESQRLKFLEALEKCPHATDYQKESFVSKAEKLWGKMID